MEADFAQLEFRAAAFLSQDKTAIDEVINGFDVHSYTASIISDAGQPTDRQTAKAHTFAPFMGRQALDVRLLRLHITNTSPKVRGDCQMA